MLVLYLYQYRKIVNSLLYHDSIYQILNISGDPSRQISRDNFGGKYALGDLIPVTNLTTALAAIQEIVEEGEGSSPCNPYNFYKNKAQLSHYFLFKCIVEKHQIRVSLGKDDISQKSEKYTTTKDQEDSTPILEVSKKTIYTLGFINRR